MDRVVGTDQEIRSNVRELAGRREHQLANALQVPAVQAIHVFGERVRMHRHFGMCMWTEKLCAFRADGPIAKRSAFG